MEGNCSANIVELRLVTKVFPSRTGHHPPFVAVNRLSLDIRRGEILALVGESGSGKSTTGLLITHLLAVTSGDILYNDHPVSQLTTPSQLRRYRKDVQIVFQDPFSSLNPIHTVGYHLLRPVVVHRIGKTAAERRAYVLNLLDQVGLSPALSFFDKLPHQLSGGQRQRVSIARALASQPQFIVADEPTSMLDVSLRIDILNLLLDFQNTGLTYLYITHDLASAQYVANRIAVLYKGHLVELGSTDEIIHHPGHPYTAELIHAVADATLEAPTPLERSEPGSSDRCVFYARCSRATATCNTTPPSWIENAGHGIACHHPL
ncbi:MAG: ABC transporter ATP-binding protein [Sulfobacillus thermosulfidooxidans]|nr:MAG: ABC transporter ATP-binding protein [Sulfobacillus thermosulfidooxidans]